MIERLVGKLDRLSTYSRVHGRGVLGVKLRGRNGEVWAALSTAELVPRPLMSFARLPSDRTGDRSLVRPVAGEVVSSVRAAW